MFHKFFQQLNGIKYKQIALSTDSFENIKTTNISIVKKITLEEIENTLSDLAKKNQAIPARIRIDVFKMIFDENPESPEKVPSKIVRSLWDYDLEFAKSCLKSWTEKKELAEHALKNIDEFYSKIELPDEMSFYEHSYYCFCLSALMSGVEIKELDKEYNKQISTMVYTVVRKVGKWTIKTELENQNYAKYICQVSKTGLAKIEDINQWSFFKQGDRYCGIRLLAIACNARLEFDGVKDIVVDGVKRDVRSLEVLLHDFIHAGFLSRHYQKDKKDYFKRFAKVAEIFEYINQDPELKKNEELKKSVEAAVFFFFHEYTTSIFVDGIPPKLPERHLRTWGKYATQPQMLLSTAAKIHLFPELFKNEIDVELDMLKSLKIQLYGSDEKSTFTQDMLVEIINEKLNPGYEYLNEKFSEFYNVKGHIPSWTTALLQREVIDEISDAIHSIQLK